MNEIVRRNSFSFVISSKTCSIAIKHNFWKTWSFAVCNPQQNNRFGRTMQFCTTWTYSTIPFVLFLDVCLSPAPGCGVETSASDSTTKIN